MWHGTCAYNKVWGLRRTRGYMPRGCSLIQFREMAESAVHEFQSHDRSYGARPLDAAKPQSCEHPLPAEVLITATLYASSQRPCLNRRCALVASERDSCVQQRQGDTGSTVAWVNEQAGHQPDRVILIPRPVGQQVAPTRDRGGVSRSRATGAPADGFLANPSEYTHRCRAGGGHRLESALVSAAVPASGELPTRGAERHAPAMASRPSALEQALQVVELLRSHRPDMDIGHVRSVPR